MSDPVGATRRATAERVESTVELCRGASSDTSDKSTGRYDSKTRVGPRRVASGRAWNWLMSRRRGRGACACCARSNGWRENLLWVGGWWCMRAATLNYLRLASPNRGKYSMRVPLYLPAYF